MSYSLKETPRGIELDIAASGREPLVRESLAAVLEALYGKPSASGTGSGQAIPIQAAGLTLAQSLPDLVTQLLDQAPRAGGVLGSPRWLSFDEGRVTATLPLLESEGQPAGEYRLLASRVTGESARFVLSRAVSGR